MFKNYFRTAFRTLLRNKIYSIINVVGLSLGLGCAILIILYVEDEISYDRFHQNVSHIYRVNRKIIRDNGNIDYSGYTGLFQGPKFTAGIPEIQAFVRFKNGQKDIKNGTDIHLQEVFNFLINKKLGYDDSNLVSADINSWGRQSSEANLVKEELMKNPNIMGVAFKNGGSWRQSAKVNGETQIQFIGETVDESYIPLLRIPVIKGRNFSKEFPSDSSHSVLVNETFVKNAGWRNPIGQEVNFWESNGKKYAVIGVVRDHHYQSLTRKIEPQLFATDPNISFGKTFIKIKPDSETATLGFIERVFKKIFPLSPYSYVFMDQENQKNYEMEARWKKIFLFGAILTIFISCIGLFGLSVLAAEKRTKEIGIRKVLGASISSVITTLSKGFLKLVIIALFIAVPVAWLSANKWLENYPYRITLSWSTFIEAVMLVIFIALATVSFQSIQAAMANPVKSLRTE